MTMRQEKDLFSLLRQVNATLGRGPRQGLNVKPGQNKVLKLLVQQGTMAQADLMRALGIRSPSLYELLQKLENDGYITRERTNQYNALNVTITEGGRIAILENELSNKERDMTFFGKLSKKDKEDLTRILHTLLDVWKDSDLAPHEAEGKRRERCWKENEAYQQEQRKAKTISGT